MKRGDVWRGRSQRQSSAVDRQIAFNRTPSMLRGGSRHAGVHRRDRLGAEVRQQRLRRGPSRHGGACSPHADRSLRPRM